MGFLKEASSSSSSSSSSSIPIAAEAGAAAPLINPKNTLSSQPKTFANFFISIVGAGVLGLPYTFKRTGWVAGALIIFSVGALSYNCMMLLARTRRRLEREFGFLKIASFGDLGLAVAGPSGRLAVDAMIVLSQAAFCTGYLIFISNTLAHLFPYPKSLYIWTALPFQLALNSIRSLTLLAPLSIFAVIVNISAITIVLREDVMAIGKNQPDLIAFGGPSVILYGIGVAVFSFEGMGMVLPLESEAADKDKLGRTIGLSMGLISFIYSVFGALGYAAFGEETRDIITTNLGGGAVAAAVQVGLCINLFFTFPIMMNPVHEVVERWACGKQYCIWLRWAVVAAVSLVALLVPNFTDFLSLVGSSVGCILAFVLPASFHLRVFRPDMGWLGVAADAGIILIGVILAVSGTYTSVMAFCYTV